MGLVFCLLTLLVVFVGYFEWVHTYWKRRGIKGPRGLPIIGSFFELSDRDHPRAYILYEWTKKFGKVFGYFEGAVPVLVISDLDMLQELFIKKFVNFYARKTTNFIHGDLESTKEEPRLNLFSTRGARWKRLKALVSPAFSAKAVKQIHATMEDSVLEMVRHMSKHEDGEAFNIHEYYQEFTYDVISRLAMGQPNSEQFNNEGVEHAKKMFLRSHRVLPWYLAVVFPSWEYTVRNWFFHHESVRGGSVGQLYDICEKAVYDRLKERVENEQLGIENTENDFIDMFLNYYSEQVEDVQYGSTVEKKVTAEDVVGSCFVFLIAGFDTTANCLAYASYALAKNPEKQKLLQEEIDNTFQNENISHDEVGKMKYMDAVVKETLRLYPIGWFACSRECVTPTTLGGISIEKGTKIEADVMTLHKDKEIWGADAEEFVPERWLDNKPRHNLSWIPFGAGPRQCVGMRLGLVEVKTSLAHVLRKYDLVAGPATEKELNIQGCVTTSPEAVTVYLKPRF